jgi:hypothetical protein
MLSGVQKAPKKTFLRQQGVPKGHHGYQKCYVSIDEN